MARSTEKITARMHRAINALLANIRLRDAAKEAGVPERTLYYWMKNPSFQAELADARRRVIDQTVRHLQHASSAALAALIKIMCDSDAKSTARTMAARTILELSIRERPASSVALPETSSAQDIATALGVVTRAVASGELKPEEGQALASLLETHRKAIETACIERQLERLEAAMENDPDEPDEPAEAA